MKKSYFVKGATCNNCGEKVKSVLEKEKSIIGLDFNLEKKELEIEMEEELNLKNLNSLLKEEFGSKYLLEAVKNKNFMENTEIAPKTFKTYWPLILVISYVLGGTFLLAFLVDDFSLQSLMNFFMGLFFLAFSFFKILDLKGFAMSYVSYDLISQKFYNWGFIYPFFELTLGILYLMAWNPIVTNTLTIVLMTTALVGVVKAVLEKRKIKCACLGAGFNLPMSTITIIEDATMVLMAIVMLLNFLF